MALSLTQYVVRYQPGHFTLVSSFDIFGILISKPIPFIARGGFRSWLKKYDDYRECGVDIISGVSVTV